MEFPNQIVRLLDFWINQQDGALIVVQQRLVGEFWKLLHQQLVQVFGRFVFPFIMEQDKIFSHLNVSGLIGFQLAQDQQVAKDQNRQEA